MCRIYQTVSIPFWNKTAFRPISFSATILPLSFIQKPLSRSKAKWINFPAFPPFLLDSLPYPNIPPFRVVRHCDKSSQGGFRRVVVTHVTTGAKSEHGRTVWCKRAGDIHSGICCDVVHLRQCWACSDDCSGPVDYDVCREPHGLGCLR